MSVIIICLFNNYIIRIVYRHIVDEDDRLLLQLLYWWSNMSDKMFNYTEVGRAFTQELKVYLVSFQHAVT